MCLSMSLCVCGVKRTKGCEGTAAAACAACQQGLHGKWRDLHLAAYWNLEPSAHTTACTAPQPSPTPCRRTATLE